MRYALRSVVSTFLFSVVGAILAGTVLLQVRVIAEQIPVRHIEGVSLGFLVLRDVSGKPIAYGDLQQVAAEGHIMDDLKFNFTDGSFYEEITKFTQHKVFRLLSDQIVQRGPSFKTEMESLLDATTGKITVHSTEKGKEKTVTKQLNLPPDVANGLLMTLARNIDPGAPSTTVSMVAGSSSPQIVKVKFSPQPETIFHDGPIAYKTQQYLVRIEIPGVKGKIAPLVGKQPADMKFCLIKSEAPTFIKFEGQMYQDGPVWRMELTAPREGPPEEQKK